MDSFRPISETAYLTAQNAPNYRRIMRSFFYEYEKMHFQLYKEDVLRLLQEYPEYEHYSIDQVKADLDSLVAWKSLTAMQDPKRVFTIADYKNKQFRYAMTEAAVEIERLTVKLENLFIEKGNLSTNLFMRIYAAIEESKNLQSKPLKEINEWWHNLQNDFKQLNQNYQDYLREFYSGKNEKLMKSLEFIQRKDLFVAYLTDFVRELQDKETLISASLREANPIVSSTLLDKVIESELTVPHLNAEERVYLEEHIHDNIYGRWQTIMDWFFPHDGRGSECERILEITNEIIRHIIQNAALIVQLQNWGLSRKDDYIHYMDMFFQCADMEEAHKLSAYIFGIQQIRHYRINGDRSTDSINSSPYEEVPMTYVIEPRVRTYRPRVDRIGFPSRTMAKAELRRKYLEQVSHDREMVLKYIEHNRLSIAAITDCVPAHVRMTLLRWISAANTTTDKKGQTEYGQTYHLEQSGGTCVLHCEDGDLTMPAYTFIFEENGHA